MHRLLTVAARAAFPAALAACIAACGDKRETEPPPTVSPPAVAAPADAQAIAALPEGANLYYVWDCDGGLHIVMKNLIRDRAVSLETHEGSRKLPQAVSASGVRYTDGVVTFWTKGDTATYQRDSGPLLNCRLATSGNARP